MNNLPLCNKQRRKYLFLFSEGPPQENRSSMYMINLNSPLLANGIKIKMKLSEYYISEYYYIACSHDQYVSRRQWKYLLEMINFVVSVISIRVQSTAN